MSMVLPKGTVIGGLTVGEPLGQGGFGITYLATDNTRGTRFALKEYFPADYASRLPNGTVSPISDTQKLFDYGLTSFITEANILKTLPRQQGLVRVRGAFEKMGTAYCVMEYIEGDPLNKMIPRLLRQHGAVPEQLIEQFLDPITHALAAIHAKKLIHRDVKPGNIMIRRNGDPVLIDFGAAQIYGRRSDGAVMFTRKYAPIEQFPPDDLPKTKRLSEGPWSDLYSLSVILYEMVCRRTPPDAEQRLRVLHQTGKDPYVAISARAAELGNGAITYSDRLLKLIDYGCSLLPEDRPADALAYRALLIHDGVSIRAAARQHDQFGSARNPKERHFPEDAQQAARRQKTSGADDSKRGAILMAGIIIAIAVVAAGLGMWGNY